MKRNNNFFKALYQITYGTESVELPFDCSKDDAIERLRADLNKNAYQALVGRANKNEVIIQRGRALFRPLFNYIFIGSFEDGEQTTKLKGIFRAHAFSQLLVSLLAVFVVVSFLDSFAEMISNPNNFELFSFSFSSLVIMILVAAFMLSLLITRNDKEWLRNNIRDAINKGK